MYQLRILVNDKPVPIYRDYRTGTDWIEARNGTKYVVEVKNNSYNRILSVVSVDGLNVVNGKHEDSLIAPGYILHAYNNIKIPGWKISADNVREFYFTPQEGSYSAKLGANPANTGVIAAAIFKEKIQYTFNYTYGTTFPSLDFTTTPYPYTPVWNDNTYHPVLRSSRGSSAGFYGSVNNTGEDLSKNFEASVYNCAVPLSQEINSVEPMKLGTGSGAVSDFRTHKTSFGERVLEANLVLYYDTREGLIRRGIDVNRVESLPRPFPNGQYCPDV